MLLVFIFYGQMQIIYCQEDTLHLEQLMGLSIEELMDLKVISASRQEEPVTEVPVPVTIITEEMIKACGSLNLKDILITYVPGLTNVEDADDPNIAMRGVYGSNQSKILMLINGHRMNIRIVNSCFPEWSNSLDKIKRIEVLRGPASSLYGNVALTGVINIITKNGSDVNGMEVRGGIGSHQQYNLSLLYGKKFSETQDIAMWYNFYKAGGEKFSVKAENDYSPVPKDGNVIVGAVTDIPAFDVGMQFNSGKLSILGNYRASSTLLPYSSTGLGGEIYNYQDYRTYDGLGPGTTIQSSHIDIKRKLPVIQDFESIVNIYFDNDVLISNHVVNPAPSVKKCFILDEKDIAGGFQFYTSKNLNLFTKPAAIIVGTQVELMRVYDSYTVEGDSGELEYTTDSREEPFLDKGSEQSYSLFGQFKYNLTKKIILNIGSRYDYKTRIKGKAVMDLSPRFAFIYHPEDWYNLKLSYSKSFVDAPYFYRYNNLEDFRGSEDLEPEYLHSFQVTSYLAPEKFSFSYTLNCFYNNLIDVIYRVQNNENTNRHYINAGRLESVGIENELSYFQDWGRIYSNLTWQYAIDASGYGVRDGRIFDVPSLTANLVVDIKPFYKRNKLLNVNLSSSYTGAQLSPIDSYKGGLLYISPDHEVGATVLFNAGIRLGELQGFSFDGQIRNILNTTYYQGGTTTIPYLQKGRWLMLRVGYRIND